MKTCGEEGNSFSSAPLHTKYRWGIKTKGGERKPEIYQHDGSKNGLVPIPPYHPTHLPDTHSETTAPSSLPSFLPSAFSFNKDLLYIAQADFQLTILLPQPPECWDSRPGPPCPALETLSFRRLPS